MTSVNAIHLAGIDHVVLRVRDLPTSIVFYRDVIGCHEERRIDELGLVQMRAGAALVDLVGVDTPLGRAGGEAPASKTRNLDHFALSLTEFDFDAIRDHLLEHDVECPEPSQRYGAQGFGPSLYIRDPDGNTIELKGPAENTAESDMKNDTDSRAKKDLA